jgi:hypothetical protein
MTVKARLLAMNNGCIRPKAGVLAMVTRLIFTLTAGFLLIGAQVGWQSAFSQANPPPTAAPVVVAQERTTAAIVEDVDPQARHVLLRFPDDTLVTLTVRLGQRWGTSPRSNPAIA